MQRSRVLLPDLLAPEDGDDVVLVRGQRDAPEHLKVAKTLAEAHDVERSTRLSPRCSPAIGAADPGGCTAVPAPSSVRMCRSAA